MNILKNLQEIEQKGFTVIKGALDPNLINSIVEETREKLKEINKSWNVGQDSKFNCQFLGGNLIKVACNPTVVKMCRRLLGTEMRFDHAFGYKTVKNTDKTNLSNTNVHGGVNSNLGMNFYRKGIPLERNFPRTFRVNVSVALTKCGKNHGGAQFLPRTHSNPGSKRYGRNCVPKNINVKDIVIPEADVGDLVVFVDSVVHGTSLHLAERISLYLMYTTGFSCCREWEDSVKDYAELVTDKDDKKIFRPPYVLRSDKDLTKLEWR